jgi:hypothetical protein
VLSAWRLSADDDGQDFQVVLELDDGSGPPKQYPQNFTASGVAQRMFHLLRNLPLTAPGDLTLSVAINGRRVAHHRIIVNSADPNGTVDETLIYEQPAASPN